MGGASMAQSDTCLFGFFRLTNCSGPFVSPRIPVVMDFHVLLWLVSYCTRALHRLQNNRTLTFGYCIVLRLQLDGSTSSTGRHSNQGGYVLFGSNGGQEYSTTSNISGEAKK